jgi:hypothetical protein
LRTNLLKTDEIFAKEIRTLPGIFEALTKCKIWTVSFKVLKVHKLTRWR